MTKEHVIDITCPHCNTEWELTQSEMDCGSFTCQECKFTFDVAEGKLLSEKAVRTEKKGGNSNYFYTDSSNVRVGPLPLEGLQSLHASGIITDATLVALEGSEKFTSYQDRFAFNATPNHSETKPDSTPPPLPAQDSFKNTSLPDLMKHAASGNADAQFNLGFRYGLGNGVKKNDQQAALWYRKAAEQGHADAQLALGLSYTVGAGVVGDLKEAVRWLRKAAEQGNADAQLVLSDYYQEGIGVEKDVNESVRWLQKAAEQGAARAQCALGNCYRNGIGVTKDEAKACDLYRKASEQGDEEAQAHLKGCKPLAQESKHVYIRIKLKRRILYFIMFCLGVLLWTRLGGLWGFCISMGGAYWSGTWLAERFGWRRASNANDAYNNWSNAKKKEAEIYGNNITAILVVMLAKLAKLDGRITKNQIDAVERIFHSIDLTGEARKEAIELFQKAKNSSLSFYDTVLIAKDYCGSDSQSARLILLFLIQFAHVEGSISNRVREALQDASSAMGARYEEILEAFAASNQDEPTASPNTQTYINEFYNVLGCKAEDSDSIIKSKYRELAKTFHPDTVAAKGLAPEFMNFAEERFKQIQEAYEAIMESRGASSTVST